MFRTFTAATASAAEVPLLGAQLGLLRQPDHTVGNPAQTTWASTSHQGGLQSSEAQPSQEGCLSLKSIPNQTGPDPHHVHGDMMLPSVCRGVLWRPPNLGHLAQITTLPLPLPSSLAPLPRLHVMMCGDDCELCL